MKNCLVTGGLGFIGSHVIDLLIEEKFNVICIDNQETGTIKNLNPKAKYFNKDITNLEDIEELFKNIDVVFHLAALARIKPSIKHPNKFLKTNVLGTLNCLRASEKYKVKRFIFSSSSSVYGNDFKLPTSETNKIEPLNPYAIQKYEGELYCRYFSKKNINVVVLRYFNVFGPRSFNEKDKFVNYSSPVGIFINQKMKNQNLTITWDGEQKRDYVYVKDVARANYLSAVQDRLPSEYNVYNVGTNENHTVNEIAKIIGGEKTYLPKREGEARVTLADNSKIRKELGWSPTYSFLDGLKETLRYEQNEKSRF